MIETAKKNQLVKSRLYEFLNILRDANINISTDEVLSMFDSLQYISVYEKDHFKQALKTTIIKDYTDIPVFDKCFEKFFEFKTRKKPDMETLLDNIINQDKKDNREQKQPGELDNIKDLLEDFLENLSDSSLMEMMPEDMLSLFLEELAGESSSSGLGLMLFNSRRGQMSKGSSQPDNEDSDLQNKDRCFAVKGIAVFIEKLVERLTIVASPSICEICI